MKFTTNVQRKNFKKKFCDYFEIYFERCFFCDEQDPFL